MNTSRLLCALVVVGLSSCSSDPGSAVPPDLGGPTDGGDLTTDAGQAPRPLTYTFHFSISGHPDDKNELDGVSVDGDGNCFVGGPFQNTALINGKERTAKNGTDFYVAKLDPKGNELWFITYDSGANDFMYDLTTDSKGDVLISGSIQGEITQNNGVSATPDGIAYFAKLSGVDGSTIWEKSYPGGKSGGNEIAVDSQDNVIATLMGVKAQFTFGGDTYTGSGSKDSFILKFSPDGKNVLWSFPFLGFGSKQLRAIGVSGNDEVIFGHEYFGEIQVGTGSNSSGPYTSGKGKVAQGLVGALAADGTLKWAKPVSSPGFANVRGVGGDSQGRFYFTGVVTGPGKIGALSVASPDRQVGFLAKVDAKGQPLWTRLLYGEKEDRGGELIVDSKDQVVIGASTNSTSYNLHDHDSKVLASELVNTQHPPVYRAALLVLDGSGQFVESYSPLSSGGSLAGVLEAGPAGRCLFVQFRYKDFFDHPNGFTERAPAGHGHAVSASLLCH